MSFGHLASIFEHLPDAVSYLCAALRSSLNGRHRGLYPQLPLFAKVRWDTLGFYPFSWIFGRKMLNSQWRAVKELLVAGTRVILPELAQW